MIYRGTFVIQSIPFSWREKIKNNKEQVIKYKQNMTLNPYFKCTGSIKGCRLFYDTLIDANTLTVPKNG